MMWVLKTYVVGTQKNRLNETVLLSTQTYVQTDGLDNIYNFMLKKFCLSKPMTVFGPCCEKSGLLGFQQSEFQTSLLSYRG